MKKLALVFCVLFALSISSVALGESGYKTPLDHYNYYSGNAIYITNPFFTQELSAGETAESDQVAADFLERAWYNLLDYEMNVLGTNPSESIAADIYRGVKNGPAVCIFCASDTEAVLLNAFFASSGTSGNWIYWFEWNTEDQTIKVLKQYTERYASDEEFLSDYVVTSVVYAAMGGDIFIGTMPDASVITVFGTGSALYKGFDAACEYAAGSTFAF